MMTSRHCLDRPCLPTLDGAIPPQDAAMDTNLGAALSSLLKSRRSVRDFSHRAIEPALITDILDDARWSPSWSNTQPYRLAIAQGAVKEKLKNDFLALYDNGVKLEQAGLSRKLIAWLTRSGLPDGDFNTLVDYPEELQERRRATGYGLYKLLRIDRHDHAARSAQMRRNFSFFGAPVVIFVFVHKRLGVYSVLDAGIYLQSLMLAAEVRGLGTCAQGALATWASPVRAAFEVPKDYRLICGVSLGWPSDHPVNQYNPGRLTSESLLIPAR